MDRHRKQGEAGAGELEDSLLEARDQRLEEASGRAIRLCFGIAVANGGLMALLAAHPFAEPMEQLAAGACCIGLHGWGAWEVGAALSRWSAAAKELSRQASEAVREAARGRARRGPPGPRSSGGGGE